jgi:membrane associated rhomboid family serine protease
MMFPPIIRLLIISNVVIFAIQMFSGILTIQGVPLESYLMRYLALHSFELGFFPTQAVTYQFLHGGFFHLLFNMLSLWMFGQEIEQYWGARKFFVYYLLCGIGAAIVHLFVSPLFGNAFSVTVGASGSIMGIILAFGMMFPDRSIMIFPLFFPIKARFFVLIYAALDLFLGISNQGGNVAHFAHVGGALFGFLLFRFGNPLFEKIQSIGQSRRPLHPRVYNVEVTPKQPTPPKPSNVTFVVDGMQIAQEQVDQLLDKISMHGYHSLTENEKKILYELSKQV